MSRNNVPERRYRVFVWVVGAISAALLAAAAINHLQMYAAQGGLGPDPSVSPENYGLKPGDDRMTLDQMVRGALDQSRRGAPDLTSQQQKARDVFSAYRGRLGRIDKSRNWRNGLALAALLLFAVPILLIEIARRVGAPAARAVVVAAQKVGSQAVEAVDRLAPNPNLIARGTLSTADELRKWVDLRDQGVISEEEFLQMRAAILGKR